MNNKRVSIKELEEIFGFDFYDEFTEEQKENTIVTLFEDGSVENEEGHQIAEPSEYINFNADEETEETQFEIIKILHRISGSNDGGICDYMHLFSSREEETTNIFEWAGVIPREKSLIFKKGDLVIYDYAPDYHKNEVSYYFVKNEFISPATLEPGQRDTLWENLTDVWDCENPALKEAYKQEIEKREKKQRQNFFHSEVEKLLNSYSFNKATIVAAMRAGNVSCAGKAAQYALTIFYPDKWKNIGLADILVFISRAKTRAQIKSRLDSVNIDPPCRRYRYSVAFLRATAVFLRNLPFQE
jgi:hypothetical protein